VFRKKLGVFVLVQDYCEFLYVCCWILFGIVTIFIEIFCGIFMGCYSGSVVIGYGGIIIVFGMLGFVSLMVGLMWLMCRGQHVDIWIFNSRT
jgi:hypothetical protein